MHIVRFPSHHKGYPVKEPLLESEVSLDQIQLQISRRCLGFSFDDPLRIYHKPMLSSIMDQKILQAAQQELMKHSWDTFVGDPPPGAKKGSVVPGCPACRKIIYSDNQYLSHLAIDVLPQILDRALKATA